MRRVYRRNGGGKPFRALSGQRGHIRQQLRGRACGQGMESECLRFLRLRQGGGGGGGGGLRRRAVRPVFGFGLLFWRADGERLLRPGAAQCDRQEPGGGICGADRGPLRCEPFLCYLFRSGSRLRSLCRFCRFPGQFVHDLRFGQRLCDSRRGG